MNISRKITDNFYYVGVSDRRLALFENMYPLENGVSYNSYLIIDKKTVLIDTVDHAVSREYIENIEATLKDRDLDFIIVNHMEPDHCAVIEDLVIRYPNVKIIGNQKTMQLISQFYDFDILSRAHIVKDGETFSSGEHTFKFIFAPMVHWPEVMFTYEQKTGFLVTSDAFGTFGALSGNIYADELDYDREWLSDARRYYFNIVGKFGNQVIQVLDKVSSLDIKALLPLHGPIWRKNLDYIIGKYRTWASYESEKKGLLVVYASIYNDTAHVLDALTAKCADLGVENIHMYDISKTDLSYLLSDAFLYNTLLIASPTYNGEMFPRLEGFLLDLKGHNFQKKNVVIVENGSWAVAAGKRITEFIQNFKEVNIIAPLVSIKSTMKEGEGDILDEVAQRIYESVKG